MIYSCSTSRWSQQRQERGIYRYGSRRSGGIRVAIRICIDRLVALAILRIVAVAVVSVVVIVVIVIGLGGSSRLHKALQIFHGLLAFPAQNMDSGETTTMCCQNICRRRVPECLPCPLGECGFFFLGRQR